MKALGGVKPGDTLVVQPQRRRNDPVWPASYSVEVVKVGRRWVTATKRPDDPDSWWHEQFDISNGRAKAGENDWANGLGKTSFTSDALAAQYVLDIERREELTGRLQRRMSSYAWMSFDVDLLERLVEVFVEAESRKEGEKR